MKQSRENERAALSEDYLREHTVGELIPQCAPIQIVDYDSTWPNRFQVEAEKSDRSWRARVEHRTCGSTSVADLPAKPILDIVLVVAESAREADYAAALEGTGYRLHIREAGWHEHRMFKGPGNSVNLHVFSSGCPE